jgi:hypothetical protein
MTFTKNKSNFYFNISEDGNETINKDFNVGENILYAIEEINHDGYVWAKNNEKDELTFLEPKALINELFVIYERNNDYILNYYYKNSEYNNKQPKKYDFKEMTSISKLSKTNNIYQFLKNYASFNDDKNLKSILSNKKKLSIK